jgi:hypothetical protein
MSKSGKRAYFRHVLVHLKKNFFNGFEISVKFCVFYTHLEFLKKKNLFALIIFVNFECKCAREGSKNGEPFL